jgi:N-acetylmuramoyl-L-alanine amidase
MLIIVDPGHGGPDPGAMQKTEIDGEPVILLEKEINLQIAKKLSEILHPDYECVLTRTDDRYLTPKERVVQIRENRTTLYISLHQIFSGMVTRTKGLYIHYNDNKSKLLAETVSRGLVDTIGWIPGGVELLYSSLSLEQAAAAIIVECRFISFGGYEPSMLLDEEFQQKIAAGIAAGIANWENALGIERY